MNLRSLLAAWVCLLTLAAAASADDWTGFRGPDAAGKSAETGLPLKWSDTENVIWKTPLPGPGASSPIVVGDRVFVTCFTGAGSPGAGGGRKSGGRDKKKPSDKSDKKPSDKPKSKSTELSVAIEAEASEDLDVVQPAEGDDKKKPAEKPKVEAHLMCFNRADGKPIWNKGVEVKQPENSYSGFVALHGYSSGTPASDGKVVYVFFGRTGVFAYDLDGNQLWTADVGDKTHAFGTANSPVIAGDLVIINASVESGKLVAFNKKTGDKAWEASGIRESWNTPLLVKLSDGKEELVVNTKKLLLAFDPKSGDKLWECEALDDYICPSVIAHDGVIFATGGRGKGSVAIRAGGKGDVTDTHVVWKAKPGSNVPSPLYHDGHIYLTHDSGIVHCLDAETGKSVYEQRLSPGSGTIYASPLLVDGRLYYVSREKGTYVLPAAPKFELLAHNVFESDSSVFNGSLIVHNKQFLMRSDKNLYCLGTK